MPGRLEKISKSPWLGRIIIALAIVLCLQLIANFIIKGNFGAAKNHEEKPAEQELETEESLEVEEPTPEIITVPRLLDGALALPEEKSARPVAAMIDNMVLGRPASGISKAFLVYEAIAEAGITRFLAFFDQEEEIAEIGPVRSARPYYIEWAEELSPAYAHCGGSPQALAGLKRGDYDVVDTDQFRNGSLFWRDYSRYAPHNLYASIENLKSKIPGDLADFAPWKYKGDLEQKQRPSAEEGISPVVGFSTESHKVRWKYDPYGNDYMRYQAGRPHKEKDGSQIRAKNVIVQYVSMRVIDSYGRLSLDTVGEGRAVVFRDGMAVEGTWEKAVKGERTRFYDAEENEVELNRGTTWIEAVPEGKTVEY